jgi:hypothetical protein
MKPNPPTHKTSSRRSPHPKAPAPAWIGIAIAFYAFITIGIAESGLGVLLPSILETFDLTPATVTFLFISQISGYVLAAFSSSLISSRLGLAPMLLVAAITLTTAVATYGLATAWFIMVAVGTLLGLGIGLIDAGINTYMVSDQQDGEVDRTVARFLWHWGIFGTSDRHNSAHARVELAAGLFCHCQHCCPVDWGSRLDYHHSLPADDGADGSIKHPCLSKSPVRAQNADRSAFGSIFAGQHSAFNLIVSNRDGSSASLVNPARDCKEVRIPRALQPAPDQI